MAWDAASPVITGWGFYLLGSVLGRLMVFPFWTSYGSRAIGQLNWAAGIFIVIVNEKV